MARVEELIGFELRVRKSRLPPMVQGGWVYVDSDAISDFYFAYVTRAECDSFHVRNRLRPPHIRNDREQHELAVRVAAVAPPVCKREPERAAPFSMKLWVQNRLKKRQPPNVREMFWRELNP